MAHQKGPKNIHGEMIPAFTHSSQKSMHSGGKHHGKPGMTNPGPASLPQLKHGMKGMKKK